VVGAVGRTGPGEQQPQVVVDFRHRTHRGAGIVAGGFLLDGNGRREPLDQVHVGFFHQLQELPGVGRKGLHVAALTFGVEGVEGEGAFTRAGQASDDRQLVAGQVQVDVLEIVGAGTPDLDGFHGIQCLALLGRAGQTG